MNWFTNKDIRLFFGEVSVLLIILLLSGLIFSQIIVHDFKDRMFTHDYEVAGYLLEHGTSSSDVAAAFKGEKTGQDFAAGKSLLQTLGYRKDIDNRLVPDANRFLAKYRLIFMLSGAIFGVLLLTAFFAYFKRQQNAIEKANTAINLFMGGETTARIDRDEEGSLSRLFASVDAMATSLQAHVEAEKHTKESLKNTIADISHQLKTPLTALKMYNEIIQEESGNEETVAKFADKTESALERMEILIQNLLKIAKFDAGTISLKKKDQNVQALIGKIVDGFETRAGREQKSITINGSGDTVLYWDPDWITEALGNLVKNALDHIEAGGRVEIAWHETPVITRITVKDDGSGIHPEDIHHIFKRFYRSRFSQDTQGIGLGLALAQSIVEAHDGTITAESTLGQGSLFTVDFLKLTNL